MIEMVVLNLPKLDLRAPLIGLAQMKGNAQAAGFPTVAMDFNLWLWRRLVKQGKGYYWSYSDNTFIDENAHEKANIDNYYKQYVQEKIVPKNPKVIAISLFCIFSIIPFNAMVKHIRELCPTSKILLGGPLFTQRMSEDLQQNILPELDYDDYIFGDAEFAIVEYLKGNYDYPSINELNNDPKAIGNFSTAYPDYSDFDLAMYPKKDRDIYNFSEGGNGWLYMSGSRGCVRRCTFCDVPSIWPNLKIRDGEDIANEMIYHVRNNPRIEKIRFTDSLLNGNPKILEKICLHLLKSGYNKNKIIWYGQWICRTQKPEFYDLVAEAGLDLISCGIESGSEKVRKDMKKGFKNSSLHTMLKEFERVGVKVVPLMMVGYPTETEEDFQMSLDLLDFCKDLNNVPNVMVQLCRTLAGSPLGDHPQEFDIITPKLLVKNEDFTELWHKGDNDYYLRIERYYRFCERLIDNNIEIAYAANKNMDMMEDYLMEKQPTKELLKTMFKVHKAWNVQV